MNNTDFFFETNFDIYNNRAQFQDFDGTLNVRLEVDPYPRLLWQFESLGKGYPLNRHARDYHGPISGHELELENARNALWEQDGFRQSFRCGGTAARAIEGNRHAEFTHLAFFLPNAKCLFESFKDGLTKKTYEVIVEPNQPTASVPELPSSWRNGVGWKCSLNDGWQLEIRNSDAGLEWLKDEKRRGTQIIASGTLSRRDEISGDRLPIGLSEAINKAESICSLLAFANGGYMGPTVMVGKDSRDSHKWSTPVLNVYSVYETSTIEQIGPTWLVPRSGISELLECLPVFERMLQSDHWKEYYPLALIWYFQVVQPASIQLRGTPWPVVANSLGALLELLAHIIIIEYGDTPEYRGCPKVTQAFDLMGIDESRFEDKELIERFFTVRNDATHADKKVEIENEERSLLIDYATMLAEEMLLWRLGYQGVYRFRFGGASPVEHLDGPRYDIGLRPHSW